MDLYLTIALPFFMVLFLFSSWKWAKSVAKTNMSCRNFQIDRETEKERKQEKRMQLLEDFLQKELTHSKKPKK